MESDEENVEAVEAGQDESSAQRPLMPALARVILYLLVYVVAQVVLGVIALVAMVAAGEPLPQDETEIYRALLNHPGILAFLTWSVFVAVLGLTVFFVRLLDRRPWVSVGLSRQPAAPAQIAVGFALGGALLATVFVVGWLVGWYRVVDVSPPGRALIRVAASLAILAPMAAAEEIALRGYVLQALEARYGWRWALALSAVIFALFHALNPNAGWPAVVGITLAGVYLGAAYLFTRGLWLPIAAHTAWNFFEGPVFGFPVSGIDLPSTILQTQTQGPRLWTGGAFGPEAGLLLALAMAAHLPLLAWATRPFRTQRFR